MYIYTYQINDIFSDTYNIGHAIITKLAFEIVVTTATTTRVI